MFARSHLRSQYKYSISLDGSSSQSSRQSSGYSSTRSSSTSPSKKVTWADTTSSEAIPSPVASRKVRLSFTSFKRTVLRLSSGKNKTPALASYKSPRSILKPPTTCFPSHHVNPGFDWIALEGDLVAHSPIVVDYVPPVPPLLASTDDDETPTSSAISTPPASPIFDRWETASDYFSDQWEVTPRILDEWSSPLSDDKPALNWAVEYDSTATAPSLRDVSTSHTAESTEKVVELSTLPTEPVQSPGEFVDGLASSLQHILVLCGISLFIFSFLFVWTIVLLTCGLMIASVAPAVFLGYWLLHLITRTKLSFEVIAHTTLKIGGIIGLAIALSCLVLIELLVEEVASLYSLATRGLPIFAMAGIPMIMFCILLGSNMHDLIAYGVGFLIYL